MKTTNLPVQPLTKDVRRAYAHFRRYGLSAKHALSQARAEVLAERLGLAVEWTYDPEGCCNPEECATKCADCRSCRIVGGKDETLACMGGICGAEYSDGYRRDIAAELFSEALAWIKEQPSRFPRWSDGTLMRYADGGYPIHYYTQDGGELCADCANKHASEWNTDPSWRIIAADVYWEGPTLFCDHCNAEMPSAYGDPWAEDAQDDDE